MSTPPLLGRLRQRASDVGRQLGRRALAELLTDQQRNEAMELAARGVLEGRRFLDDQFERLFSALGLATQADLERLAKKVAKLRRVLEDLVDEVEAAASPPPAPTPPRPPR